MLAVIIAVVVATTTALVGLILTRDIGCPPETSPSHFLTASSWQQCGLA